MVTIRFLGGPETGDVGHVDWGRYRFELNREVPCDDRHIIAKASVNRFFVVTHGEGDVAPPDPMAKARAAKAAKAAAKADEGGDA